MNAISLYSLVGQYQELQHLDTDGELDENALQAIKDTLEGLEGEIQVKATNVAAYLLNLEAYAEAADDAGKKLRARSQRIQRRADVMREYLRTQMIAADMTKIESPQFTLTRKKNPPAVIVAPDAKLADEYLTVQDPLIMSVVRDLMLLDRDIGQVIEETPPALLEDDYFLVKPGELVEIIQRYLPGRMPDKKAIGDALKAAHKAHEAAVKAAAKAKTDVPVFINPVPGAHLEHGERLEVKP